MPNMAWNLTKLTWNLTIVINTRLEITKALESDVGCRVWHSKERGLSIYLLIDSMSKICHFSNHWVKIQVNDWNILYTWNILFHSSKHFFRLGHCKFDRFLYRLFRTFYFTCWIIFIMMLEYCKSDRICQEICQQMDSVFLEKFRTAYKQISK